MFTLKKKNTVKTKENESKGQKKKDLKIDIETKLVLSLINRFCLCYFER